MSNKFKTIVVDADRVVAETLVRMLSELGHEVCGVAHQIHELADLLQRNQPDLIVLDLDLGRSHDGLGVATVLEAGGPVAIVFVAKAADDQQKEDIRSIECSSLILKPFTTEKLEGAIAQATERAQEVLRP